MVKRYVKVAMCQRSCVAPDSPKSPKETKAFNLRDSIKMIEEAMAAQPDTDVVVFPEYSYFSPENPQQAVEEAESIPDGAYIQAMAACARRFKVNIIPGTIPECATKAKSKNTVCFINRDGAVVAKYSKLHLMDAIGVKESDNTIPGNELCVFDSDFGRIGIEVCFDMRFPEQARSMVLQGADIIFCPSNFPFGNPLPPRTDHWDILVQSIALHDLTYVCAVNQFGAIGNDHPFGRSQVVDPWGTVVAQASGCKTIVYATLDMQYQEEVRKRVATWGNRRPDVYTVQ